MFIEQPPLILRWLYPRAFWRMDKNEKAVYLTFDDGPIPEITPWVLDLLDKYNIKATFFGGRQCAQASQGIPDDCRTGTSFGKSYF